MEQNKNIIVFGATSAIAHAVLKIYAKASCNLYLVARNPEKLAVVADDLSSRGASILMTESYDFDNYSKLINSLNAAKKQFSSIDIVFVAHGTLPEQKELEQDPLALTEFININYLSTAHICLTAVNLLEKQNNGTIAIISSVAGDRGRKSNYIYGASKSAVNTLIEGIQGRLCKSAIKITNIKPGMIDTPMTEAMSKGILWANPETIAPLIVQGIKKGKNTIYVPTFWRLIMLVIKLIPTKILQRLNF